MAAYMVEARYSYIIYSEAESEDEAESEMRDILEGINISSRAEISVTKMAD